MTRQTIGFSVLLGGSLVAAGGCAHVADETSETPTSAPSTVTSGSPSAPATATAASGLCSIQTRDPNATIVISIDPDFAATTTTYGAIYGYALYDPTGEATPPPSSQAISALTSDLVVFANYDPGLATHSAVGFPGASAFPGVPYPFPASAASPEATTISSAAWSTGGLESFGNTSSTICYSQTFSLPAAGTYYFGDDPLYDSPSSYRGVIVVTQ